MIVKTGLTPDNFFVSYKYEKNIIPSDNIFYAIRTSSLELDFYFGKNLHKVNGAKILGAIHCTNGPAIIMNSDCFNKKYFCLNGILFETKEEWFIALTSEQKYEAMWNINDL